MCIRDSLIIPDVHGKRFWTLEQLKRFIREQQGIIVCLGDFFDSFGKLVDEQFELFNEILTLKEKYPKNVITYEKYNGITECRYFTYDESVAFADYLDTAYPHQYKQPGMLKIYWVMAKKKPVVQALQIPFPA